MNYLCSLGRLGVMRGITRRRVALASAWAADRVEWITRLPLRFKIAPVVSWATPNLPLTLTTLAIISPPNSNKYIIPHQRNKPKGVRFESSDIRES